MGKITDKATDAIAKVQKLGSEADRIFLQLDQQRILDDATELDKRISDRDSLPLYGLLVSIKDLFDEAGQRTTAGSLLLKNRSPATEDAIVVKRLKDAGALMFGRTSMTEFAYSGVGLNPHYGTPGCIFDKSLVPGGSSSGAALSVAHGFCDIAMGTDTGGSVRIPAAVNGLYGFKPSQQTVPLTGVHPLSPSFDSVGPLASTLELTLSCLKVIRDAPLQLSYLNQPLKLAMPSDTFMDELDDSIATAFSESIDKLRAAGHSVEPVSMRLLAERTEALRLTVSAEAQAFYKDHLATLETVGDPHVLSRIHISDNVTESDLATARSQRQEAIEFFENSLDGFDAMLAPTIKCKRASIQTASSDFNTVNAAMLRNTTYINLTNGCGLSMPVARNGLMPSALMICGVNGSDAQVLSAAQVIDECLH